MRCEQNFWIAFWSFGFLDILFVCWEVENVYIFRHLYSDGHCKRVTDIILKACRVNVNRKSTLYMIQVMKHRI